MSDIDKFPYPELSDAEVIKEIHRYFQGGWLVRRWAQADPKDGKAMAFFLQGQRLEGMRVDEIMLYIDKEDFNRYQLRTDKLIGRNILLGLRGEIKERWFPREYSNKQ